MCLSNYLTPCYVIDADIFADNLEAFQKTFSQYWDGKLSFGYSIKTNHSPAFLAMAKQLGMYAESVSDDEYYASVFAGYETENVIFNGPQKGEELLTELLDSECTINLDNAMDVEIVKKFVQRGSVVKARIGLRVNFDMESRCPGEMTAGPEVSRFGFCVENGEFAFAVEELRRLGVRISGLHMHYSSKTRSARVFHELARMAAELVEAHNLKTELTYVDMGGGFFYGKNAFAAGKPSLEEYAQAIIVPLKTVLATANIELILEPGASLISSAVSYYTKVINQRFVRGVKVLTVDGSRLHIDPFLTGRKPLYSLHSLGMEKRDCMAEQIICGSTCMENDRIVYLKAHEEIVVGDILICQYAGAYTMGFNSCFINLPPYVYVKQGENIQLVGEKNRNLLVQI